MSNRSVDHRRRGGVGRLSALRSFARSSRAVESLERRLMFAARIVGSSAVYATIQDAVNAAPVGATINVDAGVYSELVHVHKTVTLRGPRAGVDARSNLRNDRAAEAVVNGFVGAVNGLRSSAFHLNADNIVLDGFTVEGQNATTSYNAGINIAPGRSGVQILNNIVQHNATGLNLVNASTTKPAIIRGNLFRENNQPGQHSGRGIYSDGSITGGTLVNVIIDNNVFFKNHGFDPNFAVQAGIGLEAQSLASVQSNIRITDNIFDYNGKGILAYNASNLTITGNVFTHNRDTTSGNVRFEGGMSNVTIRDNLFYANGARAIRIDQKVVKTANQNFVISNNNFFGNGRDAAGQRTAIMVDSGTFTGTLDATGNWYGAAAGPSVNFTGGAGTGDSIFTGGNSVNYSGWKTAPIAIGGTLDLPYFRNPLDLTAPIMFADYDHGGQTISYSDTTTNNQGNVLHRYQAVDLQVTSDPGFGISAGHQLAWVKAGEWIDYTVNIPAAGFYDLQLRLANANTAASPGRFRLQLDGVNVSGSITPTTTGGHANFVTQTVNNVSLPAGVHVLRFVFETNGSTGYVANFNWFRFVPPPVIPPAPNAPSALVATAANATSVNVTWADNADNESGFIIERSTDGFDWIEIATVGENVKSYADTSVAPSTQYFYRARATNMGGDSDYSNIDDAVTPAMPTIPAAPTSLVATSASSSRINLAWLDSSNNETGFVIERSLNGASGWTQVGTLGENAESFSDTTVSPSTKYFYRVRAVNDAGASANSNVDDATTPAAPVSQTIIPAKSIWRYLDNGSNQGTAWRLLGFNDSAWKSGAGELGYGDGDEATVVSYGSSSTAKFIATYFRKTFDIADASLVSALTLRLLRDDGAVVYLNGTEIFRSNMPAGTIGYMTRASTFIGGVDETTWLAAIIDPALLVNGANLLAVEIHQDGPTSSDISFDAELIAQVTGQPTAPAAPSDLSATAVSPNKINLTWQDHASNESGYVVERSLNGVDGWIEVATTSANAMGYSDASVSPSTQYFYRVRAINAVGPSADSNIDDAITPAAPTSPTKVTLIAAGSTWKYLDNGSNQGTAWRDPSFADSAWKSGAGELGYGDGDEATVVSYGSSSTAKFITTYFRKTFNVADPAAVAELSMRLLRDDGVVIYLNGVEAYRNNMPSGTIGYTTRASTFIGGADETTWITGLLNPALLVAGQNVIAVEIHQDSPGSSDISFDMELTATVNPPASGAAAIQPSAKTSSTFSTKLIEEIEELSTTDPLV